MAEPLKFPVGKGGDVIFSFQPGQGSLDGAIVFKLADETEVLRFEADGTITIRGEQCARNWLAYHAFLDWLRSATVHRNPATGDGDEAKIYI